MDDRRLAEIVKNLPEDAWHDLPDGAVLPDNLVPLVLEDVQCD